MNLLDFKKNFIPNFGFRLVTSSDSELILNWRNSEHVRKFMHNQNLIEKDQHEKWLEKMLISPKDLYLIYQTNQEDTGLMCFNNIESYSAYWGFYLGKENNPKGTGTKMLTNAIDFAFSSLELSSIKATIIEKNSKSKYLHEKLGFIAQGTEYILTKDRFN